MPTRIAFFGAKKKKRYFVGFCVYKSDILRLHIVTLAKALWSGKANAYHEFVSVSVRTKCSHCEGERDPT